MTANDMQTEVGAANLEVAKTNWTLGEWEALAEIDTTSHEQHVIDPSLLTYSAIGHLQLGNITTAKRLCHEALVAGLPKINLAKLLIASVHNTLGRAAAVLGSESQSKKHFSAAFADTISTAQTIACQQRTIREMTRLGLAQDASKLIENYMTGVKPDEQPLKEVQATIQMLRSEVGILQHELSLAQQKRQLSPHLFKAKSNHEAVLNKGSIDLEKLKQLSQSQLGQDLWVLEQCEYKKEGFFVEFGATDGVLLSNTYLLEKEFGWKGICAEPNPAFFKKLQLNRRCITSSACIGGTSGEEVDFIFADVFGGMAKDEDHDMHGWRRKAYREVEGTVKLVTQSLHSFLTEQVAPKRIDYLSIDTEGSEYEILENFPFGEWDIRLITIEHNYTEKREKIRNLLFRNGYSRIECQWDDFYSKR
jgi:FkbM family methyltransferase